MVISDKNLGKYKIPGIYIEEIDQSIINFPIQEVLTNLVPGFSKKGPYNRPVKVNNLPQFESIFGRIDKNLENKGSFFHRTVETMLTQGPVWAVNLLKTDPNRDKLQWKSISLSSQFDNGELLTSPYERFFSRQDFWMRNEESFNDIIVENNNNKEDDKRLFHITNMSDRTITVFMYKSSISGFDLTAEEWYGGKEKVPLFMNNKDWISDYMASVLVVYGDWSNYDELSSDPGWNSYFNSNGLMKNKIQDFSNNKLVTVLAYYDVSLIPHFKDLNDRDMYIKNIINKDTDKTGLFCYFNENELLGSDYYKGQIDLLGQTLVDLDIDPITSGNQPKSVINFMSYNTNISEYLTFQQKSLDSLGNVFGNYNYDMTSVNLTGRTASNTNWYTENILYDEFDSTFWGELLDIDGFSLELDSVAGLTVDDVLYFNKSFGIIDKTKSYYIVSIDSNDIQISTEKNGTPLNITAIIPNDTFLYKLKYNFTTSNESTYILNGLKYDLQQGYGYLSPFTINDSGQTYSRMDVLYLSNDNTKINSLYGVQTIGSSPSYPNYILNNENTIILGYTKTVFNSGGTWSFGYTGVTVNDTGYITLDNIVMNTGITSNYKFLDLTFDNTYGSSSDWTNYDKLRSLKIFNEISNNLLNNKGLIINMVNGYKYEVKNPSIYDPTTFENAKIKIFFNIDDNVNEFYDNKSFLFYYIDDEFLLKTTGLVNNLITTNIPLDSLTEGGIVAKYSSFYLSYYNGNINNDDYIWMNNDENTNQKIWLKMYLDVFNNLNVRFLNQLEPENLTSILNFSASYDLKLNINSDKDNWRQTIEIEKPESITDLTNTTFIYVNKSRYSEIIKGTFLKAYYDKLYYNSPGEGYLNGEIPKKIVRIIDVKNDPYDVDLKILYTDGPIEISNNLTGNTMDYYTTSYFSIGNYVNEYKGISIDPFVVHQDSIPNGTEERQKTILDVIANGTRLAKGLSNKNRISWRYLVDSFGLGLIQNSKQQFVDLCGNKLNCLGFINMPSAKLFSRSINPSFINSDYSLNTEFIKQGADDSKNPNFYYSFGKGVGQSCVSYWFPYVKSVKDFDKFVPPAAEIAKTFMGKFSSTNSNIRPWTILGGVIRGRLGDLTDTEIRFNSDDLTPLNEMGANTIEYVENYGYMINSDNSSQSFPYSSLSLIHSREVLIELENRLYDMLLNYHWRFNTPEIRSEIKFRADQICKELKEADALYNYRNVCDKTNNTDYIIDLQMGILDTYVEIVKGMGIIVNQITILKKGDIESSGFSA